MTEPGGKKITTTSTDGGREPTGQPAGRRRYALGFVMFAGCGRTLPTQSFVNAISHHSLLFTISSSAFLNCARMN